jgi:hypothetical protein
MRDDSSPIGAPMDGFAKMSLKEDAVVLETLVRT